MQGYFIRGPSFYYDAGRSTPNVMVLSKECLLLVLWMDNVSGMLWPELCSRRVVSRVAGELSEMLWG